MSHQGLRQVRRERWAGDGRRGGLLAGGEAAAERLSPLKPALSHAGRPGRIHPRALASSSAKSAARFRTQELCASLLVERPLQEIRPLVISAAPSL